MRRALLSLLCALPLAAVAQGAGAPGCSVPESLPPARLGGEWQVLLRDGIGTATGPVERGTLRLERHPEYTDGVRGELRRGRSGERRALVSGDVSESEFHLDESEDGRTMSAVWDGVAEDCGGRLRIRGIRRPVEGSGTNDPEQAFELVRQPGWR